MPRKKKPPKKKRASKSPAPAPGPPLEVDRIVDHDQNADTFRLRHRERGPEDDVWIGREKVDGELVEKWNHVKGHRKRVSFCETVLRKRATAAGEMVLEEASLRAPAGA